MKSIKLLLLFLVTTLLGACGTAKNYSYEIHCLGVGTEGSALLKVYSYAGTQKKAIEQAKHDAVHGILFKGVVGGAGCYNQPPIVKPSELDANQSFFKEFFESGEYLRFVNLSSDGTVSAKDRLKVGSRYKVGVAVSVQKDALRKYLESRGVIKSLNFLF